MFVGENKFFFSPVDFKAFQVDLLIKCLVS